jgi:hypothetical protein
MLRIEVLRAIRIIALLGLAQAITASAAAAPTAATPTPAIDSGRPPAPLPVVPPQPAATMTDFAAAIPPCVPARAFCIGIRIHLSTQDGAPYVSPLWLAEQFAFANRMFEPIDVSFELHAVSTLDLPPIIDGRSVRNAVSKGITAVRAIDVFVVGALADLEDPRFPLFGVHWRPAKPAGRRYILLASYAWGRTMAHELGHFFGLPHSSYAISIMNKTLRTEPPLEQRRFADEEIPIMQKALRTIIKRKELTARLTARETSL